MGSFMRAGLAAGLVAVSLFASVQSAIAAPSAAAAPAFVQSVTGDVPCSGAFQVYLTLDFSLPGDAGPDALKHRTNDATIDWIDFDWVSGTGPVQTYVFSFPGTPNNAGEVYYLDSLGNKTSLAISCGLLGSIRGTAYKDGALFGGAWYKITDGGNWFVCGTVGGDGTFGVPVEPGTYFLVPLDLPGLKASGITKVVVTAGKAELGNDIKYVTDASAKHESCDLYNPPKPIPTSVR